MEQYDCIIFTAHPDDAFLGMGGTINRISISHRILLVCASNGENGDVEQGEVRLKELRKASNLSNINYISLKLRDGELIYNQHELHIRFSEILKKYNPKIIFIHHPNDNHSDHIAVYNACLTATGSLWRYHKEYTHLLHTFCFAPIHFDFKDINSLKFNVFFDISGFVKLKKESIRCHASQLTYLEKNMSRHIALSTFLGALCCCESVEAFYELHNDNEKSLDSFLKETGCVNQYKRSLIVQVCNRCPCLCPGCYNIPSKTEVQTSSLLSFLKRYKKEFNANKLTISGGDPLLKEDISYIVDSLISQGWTISLDGVGTTLLKRRKDKSLLSSLKKVSFLGLPLDGASTKSIQLFRNGMLYEDCIDSIELASSIGTSICINTVVHAQNICEIPELFSIIQKFDSVRKWQLFQYMPIGPGGMSNKEFYSVSEEQFLEVEKFCAEIKNSNIIIEPKSLRKRKNKYLLIGSDGVIWYPSQTAQIVWQSNEDENDKRVILGHIEESDIIKKIEDLNSHEGV